MAVACEPLPTSSAAWVMGFNDAGRDLFATAPDHWPSALVDQYECGRGHAIARLETMLLGAVVASLSSAAKALESTPSYLLDTEVW